MEDKCLQCLSCGYTGDPTRVCALDSLPVGSRCQLVEIKDPSENILRLMEMGLIPGINVVIERTAPLNSPFSIRLPGCTLAVRREDARRLMVAPIYEVE